jgi:undecaprenyl diphosphate synthase
MQSTLRVPDHLAIIMDGNGRWAERRGQPRSMGHRAGARAMRDVVAHCAATGVPQLTLYAFSSDNWARPPVEVNTLMGLFTAHFRSQADELAVQGIRLSVIGRRTRLSAALRRAIADAEQRTAHGRRMHLRVAIDYSSRAAIQREYAPASNADDASGQSALLPPVDLMLRTGGERRLSDFLLWESAYAELSFSDVLWPDITPAVLDDVLMDFARRDRRFGRLSARASA